MSLRVISVACLALAVAACEPGPPVEVLASTIEPTLYWSRSLQNKRIAIEGYINFNNGGDGRAIAMGPELRSQPYGAGDKLLKFDAGRAPDPTRSGPPT